MRCPMIFQDTRSRCRIVIDQLWIIYFCQIQLKFFNTFLTPLALRVEWHEYMDFMLKDNCTA